MKDRILEFDILRGLAAIWIICVWHFANYFSPNSFVGGITNNVICGQITNIMLSLFIFLSGLFTNARFECLSDLKAFYIKKSIRFYPLYAVSSLTLYITTIPDNISFYISPLQLLLSLSGLAALLNCAPSTLWFMDMLLFFIMITPLLTWKNNTTRKIILMLISYVLLYVASRKMNMVDSRFLRYTPFYFMGLLLTPNRFLGIAKEYGVAAFMIASLIILFVKITFSIDLLLHASIITGGCLMWVNVRC